MSNLSSLRSKMSDLDSVSAELEKTEKKKFEKPVKDARYWNLTKDDSGNGFARIRFLPTAFADGENGKLWVQIWDHGFPGPKGKKGPWYIEKSLTTIGRPDPCSEYNSKLWNTGNKDDKTKASAQKRRLKYHSNILVLADPMAPENEGKVFLFAYGKKIFEKIKGAMQPVFKMDPKFNPFDFWNGADFNIKCRMGSNDFLTYEDSAFMTPAPLFGGDEAKLNTVWQQEYSLNELLDPKNFKSYDELKTQLDRVLGLSEVTSSAPTTQTVVPAGLPGVVRNPTPPIALPTDESMKSFEDLLKG